MFKTTRSPVQAFQIKPHGACGKSSQKQYFKDSFANKIKTKKYEEYKQTALTNDYMTSYRDVNTDKTKNVYKWQI